MMSSNLSKLFPQESTKKLAEKIKCGKTQTQNILKKKDEILRSMEANSSSNIKRLRGEKNDEIDSTLLEWL